MASTHMRKIVILCTTLVFLIAYRKCYDINNFESILHIIYYNNYFGGLYHDYKEANAFKNPLITLFYSYTGCERLPTPP